MKCTMNEKTRIEKRKPGCFLLILSLLLCFFSFALADDAWVCSNCGHENPQRANFCGSCRQPRPTEEITVIAQSNAWLCSVCNEICSDEDSFCMICGNSRHETDQRALLIPDAVMKSTVLPSAKILEYDFSFKAKNEEEVIDYTAPVTGSYWIHLKTANSGFRVYTRVFDSQGYDKGSYYLNQDDGFLVKMDQGNHYQIKIIQHDKLGAFTMGIGVPKEWMDLGEYRIISDSMVHLSQDNRYLLIPKTSGVHTFRITKAMNHFRVYIRVFDVQGYDKASYYLNQDDWFSLNLTAGETYYIHVNQYDHLGDYQMEIGFPKNTTDISGCTLVGDSLTFPSQENVYTFKASRDVDYSFQLARADQGFRVHALIIDQGGYELKSGYLDQGDSLHVKLSAGSVYTVKIVQYKKFGTYSLNISP